MSATNVASKKRAPRTNPTTAAGSVALQPIETRKRWSKKVGRSVPSTKQIASCGPCGMGKLSQGKTPSSPDTSPNQVRPTNTAQIARRQGCRGRGPLTTRAYRHPGLSRLNGHRGAPEPPQPSSGNRWPLLPLRLRLLVQQDPVHAVDAQLDEVVRSGVRVARVPHLAHELRRDAVDGELLQLVCREAPEQGAHIAHEVGGHAVDAELDQVLGGELAEPERAHVLDVLARHAVDAHRLQLLRAELAQAQGAHLVRELRADAVDAELDQVLGGELAELERAHLLDVLARHAVDAHRLQHLRVQLTQAQRAHLAGIVRGDTVDLQRDHRVLVHRSEVRAAELVHVLGADSVDPELHRAVGLPDWEAQRAHVLHELARHAVDGEREEVVPRQRIEAERLELAYSARADVGQCEVQGLLARDVGVAELLHLAREARRGREVEEARALAVPEGALEVDRSGLARQGEARLAVGAGEAAQLVRGIALAPVGILLELEVQLDVLAVLVSVELSGPRA